MPDIFETSREHTESETLDHFRDKLAEQFGVTLNGNRLTLRSRIDGNYVSIHCVILEYTTPEESKIDLEIAEISGKVWAQHPDENAEIFYLEHGEYPK